MKVRIILKAKQTKLIFGTTKLPINCDSGNEARKNVEPATLDPISNQSNWVLEEKLGES